MDVLGLIPARGGSKGIPKKNIAQLAGKPLLAYTCEAALGSQHLTRLILNTDDPEIAAVGQEYGAEVPFMRPNGLAQDDTPILPVIQHALEWLEQEAAFVPQAVVLLQPTSPLRRSHHIDEAIDIFKSNMADTVVSVMEVPHQYNPVSLMQLNEAQQLQPYLDSPMILRRQEKPRIYARNGPAVLIIRREVLLEGKLYGERIYPYIMEHIPSLDIDDRHDLEIAEYWLQKSVR
jgi:CMP-N-acetylneuraminic acid synthetase